MLLAGLMGRGTEIVAQNREIQAKGAAKNVAESRVGRVEAGFAGGMTPFGEGLIHWADRFRRVMSESGVPTRFQRRTDELAMLRNEVILHDHHDAVIRGNPLNRLLPGDDEKLQFVDIERGRSWSNRGKEVQTANFVVATQNGQAPAQWLHCALIDAGLFQLDDVREVCRGLHLNRRAPIPGYGGHEEKCGNKRPECDPTDSSPLQPSHATLATE